MTWDDGVFALVVGVVSGVAMFASRFVYHFWRAPHDIANEDYATLAATYGRAVALRDLQRKELRTLRSDNREATCLGFIMSQDNKRLKEKIEKLEKQSSAHIESSCVFVAPVEVKEDLGDENSPLITLYVATVVLQNNPQTIRDDSTALMMRTRLSFSGDDGVTVLTTNGRWVSDGLFQSSNQMMTIHPGEQQVLEIACKHGPQGPTYGCDSSDMRPGKRAALRIDIPNAIVNLDVDGLGIGTTTLQFLLSGMTADGPLEISVIDGTDEATP